jgi:LCP family protein required for cell wall assembly
VSPGAPTPAVVPSAPSNRSAFKRLVLGCLIVVALSAATSALFISGEIDALTKALGQNPSLKVAPGSLASTGFGGPQTLLLVGDDQRALTGDFKYYKHAVLPHANEMLLVRFDPNKPWISLMSIPRELQVTINPPRGRPVQTRLNYAYTAGGIPLLLSTIKRVTGLSVNHVVVTTFGRFRRAVDAMGCVYSTVDRRYFHSNVGSAQQYQEINLHPGYQKLCGTEALQFVSYRHNDTSLVRDARDQSFLLDVKKQYGPTLTDNVHKFERIFGQAVQTDPSLHTSTGVLDLLGTLASSAGRRVRRVQFQATLLASYDTASPKQIADSVHAFLYGASPAPRKTTAAAVGAARPGKGVPPLPLVTTSRAQLDQARQAAPADPFPLEYPRVQDRSGAGTPVALRNYLVHAPNGTAYPAYVAVFAAGGVGQYYDVQGMTWTSAPQFDKPDQTMRIGRRTLSLYYEADKLRMVAWREHGAMYWARNTLTNALSNGELLAIAEQTTRVGPVGPAAGKRGVALGAAGVPVRAPKTLSTGALQVVGSVGGVLTLLGVPLLAFSMFKRRRELHELSARLRSNLHHEATLSAAVPAGPVRAPAPTARIAAMEPEPARPSRAAHAEPRIRRSRVRPLRPYLIVGAAILAGAGIVFGFAKLVSPAGQRTHAGSSHAATAAAASTAATSAAPPSGPVAVLNGGGAPGAAHKLAQQLSSQKVNVNTVANVSPSRAHGVWILYAPGAQAQAQGVARLLSAQSPTVAPIDPASRAAAGAAQVVVVAA